MQTIATGLYGIVGMFFTTNERYEQRGLSHRDYPSDSSSESSSSESEDEVLDPEQPVVSAERLELDAREKQARSAARAVRNASERSRAKLREEDYIQRKRDLKSQKENERTMYPMMWKRMSVASQTRIREEPNFREAYMTLDSIMLWTMIRKTHLTHLHGSDDSTMVVMIRQSTPTGE